MSPPLLPSFRRQQLVLDFSFLRRSCPEGVYLSLTPGDPSLWSGVLFVREGPYAGAVLRFEIAFSDSYPDDPPLVTFSSDIFHPLVVPLTTYTFAASVVDASNTISAADQDRLPPGAFSLRHGFPHWFRGRGFANDEVDITTSTQQDDVNISKPDASAKDHVKRSEDVRTQSTAEDRKDLVLRMLTYIKKAFENETLLDDMPLEAAGDPSAWHAWRAYRGLGKGDDRLKGSTTVGNDGLPASPKRPSEWKWDGVWESRVTNGIETSVSEGTLFGSASGGRVGQVSADMTKSDARQAMVASGNRQIRFSKVDVERFEELRKDILTYDKPMST
ncbi:hypothetical protein LTS07_004493 [Exophiala sideris]|uniref:UBC core domain-containing protein n=1 Tax=Exophiala sideris TaxID=1016849 RepID=A0ABR0JDQ8_9EURO|nr:hypothetical protein LTS07_004493 [Exophiala sideris]KAK5040801.1 hypothetical protein LTR13_003102 [Exophiala sideris]KAK5061863.1 hypothetical protein LTR69_005047 [Exophiala sideris]KAK5184563.1 hypothetical protein LTR44_003238 [Eurotiomycetes sp. CCFEE 6388]